MPGLLTRQTLARQWKPPFGTPINRAHPLSQGIVGAWLLQEGGGLAAYSSTGRHDMTLQEGPPWGRGQFGGVVNMDGSLDYLITTGGPINIGRATIAFISRITPSGAGEWEHIVGFMDGIGSFVNDKTIYMAGDTGRPHFSAFDGGTKMASGNSGDIVAGQEHILVGTADGSNLVLYVYRNGGFVSVSSAACFLGRRSKSPASCRASSWSSRPMRFLIVTKLVSIPPSQRLVT